MPLPAIPTLPRFEAQLLLAHILGRSRAWVLAHPETELDTVQQARLDVLLAQREAGVPLPYVLGQWEFYGLDFIVTPAVLIPRPETELLVETALTWLRVHPEVKSAVDVGTGSGCIAITLAKKVPTLRVTAIDRSATALAVACQNALLHQVTSRITFLQADLLTSLAAHLPTIQLLLANLPYIPTETLHALPIYNREPSLALDGGADGLALVFRLLQQAQTRLDPGGFALFEIEAHQGAAVLARARQLFPDAHIQVLPDLAGFYRLLVIQNGALT